MKRSNKPTSATRPRQGASRVATKRSSAAPLRFFRGLLKVAVLASVLVGVALALVWFDPQSKIEQVTHRPINEIQVEGSFRYLSEGATREVVEQLVSGSFLDLDIELLKQELELNPWVDSVSVAREWPDKLVVKVIEQQPIARWGENAFLNMRGDIVRVEKAAKIEALPSFSGHDTYAKDIMQQYLSMGRWLAQSGLELNAISLDQTRSWTLTIDHGITVKLGRERLWEKLQFLLAAEKGELGDNLEKVKAIDMRYPGGFAVAWQDAPEGQAVAQVGRQ